MDERLYLPLVQAMRQAEADLLSFMARRLLSDNSWREDRLVALRISRLELEREFAKSAGRSTARIESALTAAYAAGAERAMAAPRASAGSRMLRVAPATEAAVAHLVTQAQAAAASARLRAISSTQQFASQVIAQASVLPTTGALTRRDAAQMALTQFASRGITGMTDRAGRQWSLDTYVEMAMRHAAKEAAIHGEVETLAERGHTLVFVSDSPRECESCRPWEGKVLSTRGSHPDAVATLDHAKSQGLFHPGCTHSLSAYLPGVSKPKATPNPQGYEDRQRLRYLERQKRAARREQAVAVTPAAETRAKAKVNHANARIRDHVDNSTAKRQRHRESIKTAR